MEDFVRANGVLAPVPFVPEVLLYTASDVVAVWERTETTSGSGQPPPFWAFPWAGGQALARYLLDHPESVAGARVLDLASGSGLVAIAAMRAGAKTVTANEIDPCADAAIAVNAAANHVVVGRHLGDLLEGDTPDVLSNVDVILAGDVFYSNDMARRMLNFMRRARHAGAQVWAGDPGRAYAPRGSAAGDWLEIVTTYQVPVVRELEDADQKRVSVARFR